jgi:type IV pilus assembly protein PilA
MITIHSQQKTRQSGQGMTEYIIIVALIAVAAIGVYSFFGEAIRGQMGAMTTELSGAKGDTQKAKDAATAAQGQTGSKNLGNYTGSQKP